MFAWSQLPDRNSERESSKEEIVPMESRAPMPTPRDSMAGSALARRTQDGRLQLKGAAAKGLLNSLTTSTLEDLSEHESVRVSLLETPSAVQQKKRIFGSLFGVKKRYTLKRNSLFYSDGQDKEDEDYDEEEYCDCFCFKIPLVVDPHENEGSNRSATSLNAHSIRATQPDE